MLPAMQGGRSRGSGRGFVTSEDVARRAGVSRSTVSRTFTEGASVSQPIRLRVLKAAEALGYRVNRLAQGLIRERSNLVGVLAANLSTPYMATHLDALSRALLQENLQCLLLNAAQDGGGDITRLIDLILEFRVRAIVVISVTPPSAIIRECVANGVRVILVNRVLESARADAILADDLGGARLAAETLINAGCRRPAIVSSSTASQMRRVKAAAARFAEAGIRPIRWSRGPSRYETGSQAARELLAAHEIDSAFCVTDLLALGFIDTLRAAGKRVPEDVSVVGFHDIPQAAWLSYRLTTIRYPVGELISAIMRAVLRDARPRKPLKTVVPLELIERATVRRR
jgi:DNA-binding LacI/PurR family transcriptional regulator